jgi:magnesium transporter
VVPPDDDPPNGDAPPAPPAGPPPESPATTPDGWPLADASSEVEKIDPAEAREVTADIRALAESRGDDSAVVDLPALADEPMSRRSSRSMGTIPIPVGDLEPLSGDELRDAWPFLDLEERSDGLRILPREEAEDFFISLSGSDQQGLIRHFAQGQRRQWMRLLEPDDAADAIQEAPEDERAALLALLDAPTRKEVQALLAYEEDEAGGLMNTRYSRLRPNMTVDEAISYLRRQAQTRAEAIYYSYVLDNENHLLGVVSFRDLFAAKPDARVSDIMETEVVRVSEDMDQETLTRIFAEHDLSAIPVVDEEGRMKGIVTVDDIVDVVQEEATEDIQKFGGMAALELPYLHVRRRDMIKKRVVWLVVLLFGQMLTVPVIGHFTDQLAIATVLAVFMPLVISSGGNSGSQASTLVIRAMALGELRLADWWRVMSRELLTGLFLGLIVGAIAILRVLVLPGDARGHDLLLALVVGGSLVFVVLFGSILGSMLPFVLKRLGADPASASAPFVATLSDVLGLLIYFTVANLILTGTLL